MDTQLGKRLKSTNRLICKALFVLVSKKQINKVYLFILVFISSFSLAAQSGYHTKGDTVFYSVYRMDDVDAGTFKTINSNYAIDYRQVYYKDKQIKSADVTSFKVLGDHYSCDMHHIFYKEDILEGVDTATFRIMDVDYACDKSNIYFAGEKLEGVDRKTFRPMKIDGEYYACDHKRVYWRHRQLKGVDVKTFRTMEGYSYIAFDKKRVYYFGELIKGADSNTFEELSVYFFRDKRRVYTLLMDVVEGADANTFRVYCPSSPYGGDKNRVFYQKESIPFTNPDDFVVIGYNMAHDGHFLYFEEQMIEPVSSRYLEIRPCDL